MEKYKSEKVAVIMPAYNCSGTLERAICSVIGQSYENWHLYIINDCSEEDLEPILNKYKSNNKITIIKNDENVGVARSRNKGLKYSQERLISFLDSDDEWLPEKLKSQVNEINKGEKVCVTEYLYISGRKTHIKWVSNFIVKNDFLKKKFRFCFSSLLHVRVENLFFEDLGHEDFLYIYKLISMYGKAYILNSIQVNYYEVPGSLSSSKVTSSMWHFKILKKISMNPVFLIVNFLYYLKNGLSFKFMTR